MLQNLGISLKNSVIRRCDNRLYFARQGSSAQGFFMRQATTDEVPSLHLYYFFKFLLSAVSIIDNCFKKFLQRTIPQDAASTKCSATKTTGFVSTSPEYAAPQFSKPAKEEFIFSSVSPNQQKEKPKPDIPKLANLGTNTNT